MKKLEYNKYLKEVNNFLEKIYRCIKKAKLR